MINNRTPFDFLDAYGDECFYLYAVVKSLFYYPFVIEKDEIQTEGKLYALAFSDLCQEYLKLMADVHPHEDWELKLQEMHFDEDKTYIEKKWGKKFEHDTYSELIEEVVQNHQKTIKKDLKNTFQDKLPAFLGSIFNMAEDDEFTPDVNLDVLNYFDEF